MAHSTVTRQKISDSLKNFHTARKIPSPEQRKIDIMKAGFLVGSGVEASVRDYSKQGVKEKEARKRDEIQDTALKEKTDGISTTES
jgi:hypothetical protein